MTFGMRQQQFSSFLMQVLPLVSIFSTTKLFLKSDSISRLEFTEMLYLQKQYSFRSLFQVELLFRIVQARFMILNRYVCTYNEQKFRSIDPLTSPRPQVPFLTTNFLLLSSCDNSQNSKNSFGQLSIAITSGRTSQSILFSPSIKVSLQSTRIPQTSQNFNLVRKQLRRRWLLLLFFWYSWTLQGKKVIIFRQVTLALRSAFSCQFESISIGMRVFSPHVILQAEVAKVKDKSRRANYRTL